MHKERERDIDNYTVMAQEHYYITNPTNYLYKTQFLIFIVRLTKA